MASVIFENFLRVLIIDSAVCERRVFLMRGPQKPEAQMKSPYIIFTPTGPEPLHGHDGPNQLLIRNYQISIFDTSQSSGLEAADKLRQYFDGLSDTIGGVKLVVLFRVQTTHYEPETRLFQIITEFRFLYRYVLEVQPLAETAKE